MKQITVACLVIVLIGPITGNSVWARGGGGYGGDYGHYGGGWGYGHGGNYGHSSFGFYFGAPLYPYYSYPYQYPYYYPPAIITVPATPPVYIQQYPPAAQQNSPGYWYYCTNPEGYYPYIKECPDGWQQVAPIPPTPSSPR